MIRPAKKRFKFSARVEQLSKLLAKEKLCNFSVWLPTQYQIEKPPNKQCIQTCTR